MLSIAPGHRADEAFRRGRRVGGADLQNLRHQRRVAGNPVPHDDPASGPGHAHHLPGHIKRLGRKHGPEDTHDEVKRLIFQLVQIGRIAFLEPAVREALLPGALVSGLNQVPRDIHAQHVRSESRRRYGRRSIAAAEVQNLEPFGDSEPPDERLAAFPHALRDARKVAFFPKRFVRIDGRLRRVAEIRLQFANASGK